MSGIAGIVRFDRAQVDREELERMRMALVDMGPDRQNVLALGDAGYVHCLFRTAPQHLGEQQPLRISPQSVLLTNARIDNREEVFRALGRPVRADVPDSHLLGWAFRAWGADFAARLVGDFSCVIHDAAERRVLLVTDALGHRPLYYHWDGRVLRFASAVRALHACDAIERKLDDEGMTDWLLRNDLAPGTTIYAGILQVPPAHVLTLSERGPVLRRYWDARDSAPVRFSSIDEYGECFRELFGRVVEAHAESSHPVGLMLSGGLDSQAIASVAAAALERRGHPLHAFTLVPAQGTVHPDFGPNRYVDERAKVQALADRTPGLRPVFVSAEAEPDLAFLDEEFRRRDGPVRETPTYLQGYRAIYAQAQARGVRALLTGSVGNHTISYHGHGRLVSLIRSGRWLTFVREARALAAFLHRSPSRLMAGQARQWWLETPWGAAWRQKPAGVDWQDFSYLSAELLERAGGLDRLRARRNHKAFARLLDERERRIGRVCERNPGHGTGALSGGFEFRLPAADRRIVEFCLGLPDEVQCRDGLDRRLLRVELPGTIPEATRLDHRRGAQNVDWVARAERLQPAFVDALDRASGLGPVRRLLDLTRLSMDLRAFDPDEHRRDLRRRMATLQGVQNSVGAARFVHWFEGAND